MVLVFSKKSKQKNVLNTMNENRISNDDFRERVENDGNIYVNKSVEDDMTIYRNNFRNVL